MQQDGFEKAVLVIGATGKTGRRVLQRLTARGLSVRAGSRSGAPPFDWGDPGTWAPALRGVDRGYVSYYPDLAVAGAVETVRAFAELAVKSGVERLVLLSGRGEEGAGASERAVQASGAAWTILRASWFSQNFSEGYLLDAVSSGEVALPLAGVAEPFVDADDIADAVVAALTQDGHADRLYELTGPRLLTFAQAIEEIAEASGRDVRFVLTSTERYASLLAELQVPSELASLVTYLFTEVLDGRNAHLADGVQRALGRTPKDFADYARGAAATGVWGAVQASSRHDPDQAPPGRP